MAREQRGGDAAVAGGAGAAYPEAESLVRGTAAFDWNR
jgi:hypothetical protein